MTLLNFALKMPHLAKLPNFGEQSSLTTEMGAKTAYISTSTKRKNWLS
jgi:hypothetical protein